VSLLSSPTLRPALRWILYPVLLVVGVALATAALLGITVILAYPQLPSLELLTDYQPKIPLRVYSADGHLIGEFGEERRDLVRIAEVPAVFQLSCRWQTPGFINHHHASGAKFFPHQRKDLDAQDL